MWTFQDGTEAPISYFSVAPWKRQKQAHMAKGESHLFAPFRGHTIADGHRKSSGTCLQLEHGSAFCECGVLLLYKSHEKSLFHHRRMGAKGNGALVSDTPSATEAIVPRLWTDEEFAKWVLTVAAGTVTAAPAALSLPPSDHLRSPASSSPGTPTWPMTAPPAASSSSKTTGSGSIS
ncbi:hypothetical protein HPB50_011324 [Hyalomma asiaticum]|uniref:Uncharacterized protein n=1 Tax=Hyalomma asiaticum TaxID=266040 RepID=A0ACB7SL34_HYAAI|nr:hypothetical protein HPB50_011324 [Hyalomma asiaticum]